MKHILFGLLLFGSTLFATVTNLPVTVDFVTGKKIKIIDIRTESEWIESGVIKDAVLITFFSKEEGYSVDSFVEKLNHFIDKGEQFAVISNSGSRSKLVSNFLGNNLDYDVINLTGGMSKLIKDGYKVKPYDSSSSKLLSNEK